MHVPPCTSGTANYRSKENRLPDSLTLTKAQVLSIAEVIGSPAFRHVRPFGVDEIVIEKTNLHDGRTIAIRANIHKMVLISAKGNRMEMDA